MSKTKVLLMEIATAKSINPYRFHFLRGQHYFTQAIAVSVVPIKYEINYHQKLYFTEKNRRYRLIMVKISW